MNVDFPDKVLPVLKAKKRYKVLYGGRGSAKSWTVAKHLVIKAAFSCIRVLCTREYQSSVKDSVYKLLCDQISKLGLEKFFDIQRDVIRGIYGSEFIFKGLKNNPEEIKSTEGIDIP